MDNERHAIEGPSDEFIEVVCMVVPTGKNLWWPARDETGERRPVEYSRKIVEKWKDEHPEFAETPCSAGMVMITMPREKYLAIGAQCGPGCFEFPEG